MNTIKQKGYALVNTLVWKAISDMRENGAITRAVYQQLAAHGAYGKYALDVALGGGIVIKGIDTDEPKASPIGHYFAVLSETSAVVDNYVNSKNDIKEITFERISSKPQGLKVVGAYKSLLNTYNGKGSIWQQAWTVAFMVDTSFATESDLKDLPLPDGVKAREFWALVSYAKGKTFTHDPIALMEAKEAEKAAAAEKAAEKATAKATA